MSEHKFTIVKSIRIPIIHSLVALNGVKKSDIKEIVSHEQALSQCRKYLEQFDGVKITEFPNTALAARYVKESGRTDVAALCSKEGAEKYGLSLLEQGVQDSEGNYTRFILITKDLEIYSGAQKISIMTTLPHSPGSLYKMLGRFSNLGINLTKLESRPIVKANFEFNFYFDFDCDIKLEKVQNLLAEISEGAEKFTFLGAYNEIIC
jgi:chorismate mutase/prephenate dehydratase